MPRIVSYETLSVPFSIRDPNGNVKALTLLDGLIQESLAKGWQPLSGPTGVMGWRLGFLIQAIVKYES